MNHRVILAATSAAFIFVAGPSFAQSASARQGGGEPDPFAVAPEPAPTEAVPVWTGSVGCSHPATRQNDIFEVGSHAAANKFNNVTYHIADLAGTWGRCLSPHVRSRFEASVTNVQSRSGDAKAGLIGAGVSIEVTPNITLTPIARVGFEDFSSGLHNTIYDGAVTAEGAWPLGHGPRTSYFTLAARPEVSSRQSAGSNLPGQRSTSTSTTLFGASGFDFASSDRTRTKVELVYQHYSSPSAISHTESIVASTRLLTERADRYTWNLELWYTRGDHGYQSMLLGVTYRFAPLSHGASANLGQGVRS